MFVYKEADFISRAKGKSETSLAEWIDQHPDGISGQLRFAQYLVRAGFSVHTRAARITLYAMAMEQLSVSEQLALLLHEMRGEDCRFLDENNDPNPAVKWIGEPKTDVVSEACCFTVPSDYCAVLLESEKQAENICGFLDDAMRQCRQRENQAVLEPLQRRERNILREIRRLKDALAKHQIVTFGLVGDGAWDLDSSNYFDEPNPRFCSCQSDKNTSEAQ